MSHESVEQRQTRHLFASKQPKVGLRGSELSILQVDYRWGSVTIVSGASQLSQMQAVLQKSDDKRCKCQDGADYSEDDSCGVVQRARTFAGG